MAPIKVAVFPLVKNKPELMEKARGIYESILLRHNAFWDVSGAIGERTPFMQLYRALNCTTTYCERRKCLGMIVGSSLHIRVVPKVLETYGVKAVILTSF